MEENTKVAELKALFEKYGKLLECDIVKNYGFVHYSSENDAREAIANLNGYVLNGNAIKVENAKSRRSANANTSTKDSFFVIFHLKSQLWFFIAKIFIGNLTEKTKSADVRLLFEKYGTILECDIIRNYGFVHIDTADHQNINEIIRDLNGKVIDNQAINVQVSARSPVFFLLSFFSLSPSFSIFFCHFWQNSIFDLNFFDTKIRQIQVHWLNFQRITISLIN